MHLLGSGYHAAIKGDELTAIYSIAFLPAPGLPRLSTLVSLACVAGCHPLVAKAGDLIGAIFRAVHAD